MGRRLIDDPLWTWIAGFGPAGLRVLLGNGNDERSGCPPIRLPARATGICHLCVALLGRKEVVRQARRLLGGHPRRR